MTDKYLDAAHGLALRAWRTKFPAGYLDSNDPFVEEIRKEISSSPRPVSAEYVETVPKSPCNWCKKSSYFTRGSNIMREPCSSCVDSENWKYFDFSGANGLDRIAGKDPAS